jgi:hypothetical protein
MSVNMRDKIEKLNAVERKKIQGRAADLIPQALLRPALQVHP